MICLRLNDFRNGVFFRNNNAAVAHAKSEIKKLILAEPNTISSSRQHETKTVKPEKYPKIDCRGAGKLNRFKLSEINHSPEVKNKNDVK